MAAAAVCVTGLAAPAVAATRPAGSTGPWYLALGDSVAFGYTPSQVTPPQWYLKPNKFRSYANFYDLFGDYKLANASCPGETSASLNDDTQQSNGCETEPNGDPGYRAMFPLHVNYAGSQLDYATNFLTKHKKTALVTINIGANDIFLCQEETPDQCTGSDFPATLQQIANNLSATLTALRNTGYAGRIIVMEYYSISYTDTVQVVGTTALNQTLTSVAHAFGVDVADGFTAFKKAAGKSGDPCAAGLLIKLPDDTCNIHPSQYGHSVLALAFEHATPA